MEIPSIDTTCEEAILTHFSLQLETAEVEGLSVNSSEISVETLVGNVRQLRREQILRLGIRFLETTLEVCESCDKFGTQNDVECPNIATLGFIRDTLTK